MPISPCNFGNFLQEQYISEVEGASGGPLIMNAFEMIALSQGLNLSALFDRRQVDFVSTRRASKQV